MNIRPLIAATLVFTSIVSHASSEIPGPINFGAYTVEFDPFTTLGIPTRLTGLSGGAVGFKWAIPSSMLVFGTNASQTYDLPDFTITVNPNWSLSGPFVGFIGNLVFNEVNGSTTSALVGGTVSINGGTPYTVGGALTRGGVTSAPDFSGGSYSATGVVPLGAFTSLSVTGATLTLSTDNVGFGSIISQPQNELKFTMIATSVPEPESAALMLAGLLAIGTIIKRRQRA